MCNLYSLTRSQDEIRQLARAQRGLIGNLPPLPGIYPDTLAPVVRTAEDGVRELALMRWGSRRHPQAPGRSPRCGM